MASPQKPKQPASRWAFLSSAVASVESGLDRILAEDDESTRKASARPARPQENGTTSPASLDIKRSDSANRTNDRLQARLAHAMAKKTGSRATTPIPDSEPASRPETPGLNIDEAEQIDQIEKSSSLPKTSREEQADNSEAIGTPLLEVTAVREDSDAPETASSVRESKDSNTEQEKPSIDKVRSSTDSGKAIEDPQTQIAMSSMSTDPDATLLHVQIEHEKSISSLQEEINGYLERIDALQRNLQMMAKETIADAKGTKNDSSSTLHQKQLAGKDEKIALLIEEGTKLTKSELQYRNMIKKLRAQATTSNKDQEAVRQRAEKAEKSISALEARALKAESEARQRNEQISALSKSSSDVAAITKERNALQSTLTDVRNQLSRSNKRAEEAESKAQTEKLEAERKKVLELQDDLSSARVERELIEDKLKREIDDLRQSVLREKEHARQMENEMLAEQAALESKLEGFRLRVEEASTADQGDSQAKLLRQIETLQSQYSAASQNWQGIESTLLTRITTLEQERDELSGREADLRRKLRDATSKAKNATKELDEVQQSLHVLQDQEADREAENRRASNRAEQLEEQVAQLRKELEDQKVRAEKEVARRLEEEKAKWIASMPRIDSPVASLRKSQAHPASFMDVLTSPVERPSSRRSSNQPLHEIVSNPRMNSSSSFRANGTIPETPSVNYPPDDQDDFFANVPPTPASTSGRDRGGNLNDMMTISASTAGAGPSVQLVERLSTTVRRLESEKAASKDELTRLSSQRDEARQEVVNLMREVEQKRNAEDRLQKLEKEHTELSGKHQATLELLGEKTEQVDELKADILDVKAMYRHLADTMGKS